MYIENDTIHFKSGEPYYTKEKSGIKNNTVRFISDEEHDIILDVINNLQYICITNIMGDHFARTLSDITIFKVNSIIIYIFSWRG